MKRLFAGICLIAATVPLHAAAATTELTLHTASYHFDRAAQLNEVNPGLGVLRRHEAAFVAAGAYRNSLSNNSVYAAAGWQPVNIGGMRVGAMGGAVTGYRWKVAPLAAGVITVPLRLNGHAVNIHCLLIPTIKLKDRTFNRGAVSLMVGIPL
ncbi:MAG: hypothetical protein ACRCV9_15265 [Burkholderiaceae bacterium]